MARSPSKPFYCTVISENVSIALRRRSNFRGDGKLFVQCSEVDCQWVDANEPRSPLPRELSAAEVRAGEPRRARCRGSAPGRPARRAVPAPLTASPVAQRLAAAALIFLATGCAGASRGLPPLRTASY